jgi:hypothetical protein
MTRFRLPIALLACALLAPPAEAARASSDPEAVRLAKRVLEAMGGRDAWTETRFVAWDFYGRRFHVWDKWTGDLRTDTSEGATFLLNLRSGEGRAWKGGEPIEGEALAATLETARAIWINDSYWLAMPFKLLDPGVRLQWGGRSTGPEGEPALRLRLTFDGVGVTPWNAYDVFVDPASHRVTGWAYYASATDGAPRFSLPWRLERRGRVLLPADHGRGRDFPTEVFEDVPRSVFTEPEPRMTMERLLDVAEPAPREGAAP